MFPHLTPTPPPPPLFLSPLSLLPSPLSPFCLFFLFLPIRYPILPSPSYFLHLNYTVSLTSHRPSSTDQVDIDDKEVDDEVEVEEELFTEIEIEVEDEDEHSGRPAGPIIRIKSSKTQP
jgi:hypothetical protein